MAFPKEKKNDLDGITYHGVPIEEKLKDDETKQTQSVYSEEVKEKSHKTPIHLKVKYRSRRERRGKVMTVTNLVQNEDPMHNFRKSNTVKHLILSLLLTGDKMTSAEMHQKLLSFSDIPGIKKIVGKDLKKQQIFQIMNVLLRSDLNILGYLRCDVIDTKYKKNVKAYYFADKGRNLTLEETIELAVEKKKPKKKKDIPKKKIKKAVEDYKLEAALRKIANEIRQDFVNVTESTLAEVKELREIVNRLMIDTPAKDLSNSFGIDIPKTIKVDIPTNFHFNFHFSYHKKEYPE